MQLDQEMEKSRILEECLRVLAQEHLSLEQSISSLRTSSAATAHTVHPFASSPSAVTSSEMDEFFDCGNFYVLYLGGRCLLERIVCHGRLVVRVELSKV